MLFLPVRSTITHKQHAFRIFRITIDTSLGNSIRIVQRESLVKVAKSLSRLPYYSEIESFSVLLLRFIDRRTTNFNNANDFDRPAN
jgi:hypothetical protein